MVVPVGVIKRVATAVAVVAWTTMVAVQASTTTVASFNLHVNGVVVFFVCEIDSVKATTSQNYDSIVDLKQRSEYSLFMIF
jgi:hypothetical protein